MKSEAQEGSNWPTLTQLLSDSRDLNPDLSGCRGMAWVTYMERAWGACHGKVTLPRPASTPHLLSSTHTPTSVLAPLGSVTTASCNSSLLGPLLRAGCSAGGSAPGSTALKWLLTERTHPPNHRAPTHFLPGICCPRTRVCCWDPSDWPYQF